MPDQPSPRNSAHVLRDLHSYIAEPALNIDALSEHQIEVELKRRSISPKASFQAIHELLDDHIAASELAVARQNRLARLEAVKPSGSILAGVREKIHNLIQSLNPQVAGAYWSKFESASDEELQSLYDDLMELGGHPDNTDANGKA
jgi:hypothetical protein